MLLSLTAGSERTRRSFETVFATEPRRGSPDGAGETAAEGWGALEGVAPDAAGVDGCAEALGDGVGLGDPQPASIAIMTMAALAARPLCRIPTPVSSINLEASRSRDKGLPTRRAVGLAPLVMIGRAS